MKRKYIPVIDSGVGGLSVLKILRENFPKENYIYLADNRNAPYGNKSIRELKKLIFEKLTLLNFYNIKFLVVACNTLSCSLISFIKEISVYPVYGIYPPIEMLEINNSRTLLLSTNNTSRYYKESKIIKILPQKDLAFEIENNINNLDKIRLYEIIEPFFQPIETIVLGCTHYFFIKKRILDHFDHQKVKNIICSEDLIVNCIQKNTKTRKSLVKFKRNKILFLDDFQNKNELFFTKVVK